MRRPRILVEPGKPGLYHCTSRIVGGQFLFGPVEKEAFIRMMRRHAEFLCIEVVDYTVMDNHFHQTLWVPGVIELSDAELLDKVSSYYGANSPQKVRLRNALKKGGAAAQHERRIYLRRMGKLSEFERILKQTFSAWYNKRHERYGTLWAGRFGSELMEDAPSARQAISAYIALNAVRAGIVYDPKDYRYGSYAAALAGDQRCRRGIMRVMAMDSWHKAMLEYRLLLMRKGCKESRKGAAIAREVLLRTLRQDGHLSLPELLRLRVRYFTDGLVIGSALFVEQMFQQYRSHFGERRRSGARPVRGLKGSDLYVIRDLRRDVIS